MRSTNLIQVVAAGALLAFSVASPASEPAGARMVTGVGEWIAAQGNRALEELREDVRRELQERFAPASPAPEQPASVPAPRKVRLLAA